MKIVCAGEHLNIFEINYKNYVMAGIKHRHLYAYLFICSRCHKLRKEHKAKHESCSHNNCFYEM